MNKVKVIQAGYETVEIERTLFLMVPNDWSEDQIVEAVEAGEFEDVGWTVSMPEEIYGTPENIDWSEIYEEDFGDLPEGFTCYSLGDEEEAVRNE